MKTSILLQHIYGVVLLAIALILLSAGTIEKVAAVIFFTAGVICQPAVRNYIEHTYNFRFSQLVKYAAAVISGLILVFLLSRQQTLDSSINKTHKQVVKPASDTSESSLSVNNGSTPGTTTVKYGSSNTTRRNEGKRKDGVQYIRGPRGGCYYINAKGKKVYVDRGYCS